MDKWENLVMASTFVVGALVGWEFESFAYGVAAWLIASGAIVWLAVLYDAVESRVAKHYAAKHEGGR